MRLVKRKVTYRIYPSVKQEHRMTEMLRSHQRLYNAALEQRIDAYQRCGVSVGYNDQAKELTALRAESPEYARLNAQSEQVTLKRLDLAFKGFFRRHQDGSKSAGFPRFKSFDRYPGWGYAAHGDGWLFTPGEGFVNGFVRVSGVGHIQARGRPRFQDQARESRDPGKPKTMEVMRKGDQWYASITFEGLPPFRAKGPKEVGVDWGTLHFLTVVGSDEGVSVVENPRLLKKKLHKLRRSQQTLSRRRPGSKNRLKAKEVVRACHRRVGWKRDDFLHQTSAWLVGEACLIATEELNITGMTASGGAYKKGLNRAILDTSPGKFFKLVEFKAADAGTLFVKVPTRKVKPSQRCSGCGTVEKKTLDVRLHDCQVCGLKLDRDVNAARNMLKYATAQKSAASSGEASSSVLAAELTATGREPASGVEEGAAFPMKHETPSIAEAAFS